MSSRARRRARHRRNLLLLVLGATAAAACWLVRPFALAGRAPAPERAAVAAAPAEPALRPNPATEPVLGLRAAKPGEAD